MNRKGFTLIELLVVITIISVLISILLPALSKARDNAIKLNCLTKLRQCGLAFMTYASDNNEALPTDRHSSRIANNWGYGIVRPGVNYVPNYLSSWEMADCPNNPLRVRAGDTGNNGRCQTEYSYMAGMSTSWYYQPPKRLTDSESTRRALVGDRSFLRGTPSEAPNHSDGSNWILLDGHGQWFSYDRLGYHKPSVAAQIYYTIYPKAEEL